METQSPSAHNLAPDTILKRCTGCWQDKPLTAFDLDRRSKKGGRFSRCKTCRKLAVYTWRRSYPERARDITRRYQRKHREKVNASNRRCRYGLSVEDYDHLVRSQRGRCLICGNETTLAVDHDHQTGYVRGLLCRQCNSGLGNFKDSPSLLIEAARYLVQHEAVDLPRAA